MYSPKAGINILVASKHQQKSFCEVKKGSSFKHRSVSKFKMTMKNWNGPVWYRNDTGLTLLTKRIKQNELRMAQKFHSIPVSFGSFWKTPGSIQYILFLCLVMKL